MLSLKSNSRLESLETLSHRRVYDTLNNTSRKCNNVTSINFVELCK